MGFGPAGDLLGIHPAHFRGVLSHADSDRSALSRLRRYQGGLSGVLFKMEGSFPNESHHFSVDSFPVIFVVAEVPGRGEEEEGVQKNKRRTPDYGVRRRFDLVWYRNVPAFSWPGALHLL